MGRKRVRPKAKEMAGPSTKGEEESRSEDVEGAAGGGVSNSRKSVNSNNGKKKSTTGRASAIQQRLADKPVLTKEDLMCPICWSTLFEPATLPCNHSLCEKCFRKHINETALTCPCCRLRLSIWCRKTMKDGGKLLDEALWNRMKVEFPRLVQARTNGEDTQNIMDDDLPMEDAPPIEGPSRSALDGTMCEKPGEIKEEFQSMMKQHEKDLELERLREETASSSFIKQIQEEENLQKITHDQSVVEEDYLLALKLQKEFEEEEEERLQRSMRSTQQRQKSLPRNLMNELNSKNICSPDITDLPVTPKSNTKPLRASLSINSSKGKSNGKRASAAKNRSSATVTSSDVSRASQNVMSKFLSLSQNQLASPETNNVSVRGTPPDSATPCCSKSLPVHDVRFSAFSPTKPSASVRLFVPAESLAIPISAAGSFSPLFSRTSDELGTSTKTPDSINSEVDRHFRPIRGAPKTPPRRRPDGTFLPEPKLMRTTPIKPIASTSISAYIRSPLKQMSNETRPSCATIEKRISNDSGRASDDSRSPDVDGIDGSPTSLKGSDNTSLKAGQSYQNDRGRISEDYRVTPEDNPKTPENSKKRILVDDNENVSSDSKKVRVETNTSTTPVSTPVKGEILAMIKEEPGSPSLLDESFSHAPQRFDITCTQGIITIEEDDQEYLTQETEALNSFKKKAAQEAADRAFAEALQKDMNRETRSSRERREKYSLRSWLNKPNIKRTRNNVNV